MQFSLMRFLGQPDIDELTLELYGDIDGAPKADLEEFDQMEYLVDLSGIAEGIEGSLITVHITDTVTTSLGQVRFLHYKIPVVLRKSSMALIGSDGEDNIERAVTRLLSTGLNLVLEPLTPKKTAILKMLEYSKRVERPMLVAKGGVLAVEEDIDFFSEVILPSESKPLSWSEVFSRYSLSSANLIFRIDSKELLLRFFIDSIWLDDDIEANSLEYLINVLERFLLEGKEYEKRQGSLPEGH